MYNNYRTLIPMTFHELKKVKLENDAVMSHFKAQASK